MFIYDDKEISALEELQPLIADLPKTKQKAVIDAFNASQE